MHVSKADLEPTVIGEYEGHTVDSGDVRIAFARAGRADRAQPGRRARPDDGRRRAHMSEAVTLGG